MSNVKIQMQNQAQNPKTKKGQPPGRSTVLDFHALGILSFGFLLAFELWNLTFEPAFNVIPEI